jgi:hypothetical protein
MGFGETIIANGTERCRLRLGLLAMGGVQSQLLRLEDRIREQARSHRG